jgi:phage gp36-like protein
MYCTLADISPVVSADKIEKMLEEQGNGSVSKATIENFIEYADNKINTALGGIYVVPITGAQSLLILKGISVALTVESLYNFNEDGKVPDRIKQEADQAREELTAYGIRDKWLPDAIRQNGFVTKRIRSREVNSVLAAN